MGRSAMAAARSGSRLMGTGGSKIVDLRTGDRGLIGEVGLVNDDLLGNDDLIDCGDGTTCGCRSTPNRQSNLQFNRQLNRPSPINPHSPIKNPQSIPNPQSFDPQFSLRALPPRREHALQRDAEVERQVRPSGCRRWSPPAGARRADPWRDSNEYRAEHLSPRFPIAGPTPAVRHSDDQNASRLDAIDHAEWKTAQQVAPRAVIERRPRIRESNNGGLGRIDFLAEGRGGRRAARGVPASRRLSFFEGLAEVLKLAGHGRLPRGCDDGPPTRGWSRRSRHRPVRAAPESPPTTPLPRPDPRRDPGFESAGPPAQRALHPRGGAPRPTAVRHPSQERNTGTGTPRDLSAGENFGIRSSAEHVNSQRSNDPRRLARTCSRSAVTTGCQSDNSQPPTPPPSRARRLRARYGETSPELLASISGEKRRRATPRGSR